MSINKQRGATVVPQRDDEQEGLSSTRERPEGDVEPSKGIAVFRDCRGELVWLD